MKMLKQEVHKISLLILGALECLCFGGWIFGWASLVFVLKLEGYFEDRCSSGLVNLTAPDEATTVTGVSEPPRPACPKQDSDLQLVFTVANFCVSGSALPLGLLYDKFGTLFMRVLISVLMLLGSLMFAFSSINHLLVFPAAVCVSAGGVQLLVVNLQISSLFGRSKWIVMTIFSGCFDSSAWVFLAVKVLYESVDLPMRASFLILGGCTLFLTVNTFFLLPKLSTIPWPLPDGYRIGSRAKKGSSQERTGMPLHVYRNSAMGTEGRYYPAITDTVTRERTASTVNGVRDAQSLKDTHSNGRPPELLHHGEIETPSVNFADNAQHDDHQEINPLTKDFPSLRACVLSPLFFFFYLWFSILQLDVLFFVSTLNPVLTRLAENDEKIVSSYTNAQAFIQVGGILCAPLSGLLLSRNKRRRRCRNKTKEEDRLKSRGPYSDIRDAALVYAVCTSIFLLFCTCGTVPVLEVQYATFVLQVLSRSFVYGLAASGASLFFPAKYFGTMYGLLILLSAVFSLLQYPLFTIVQNVLDNKDYWVKIALLCASLLTYSFPVYIYFYSRKKEKALRHETQDAADTTSYCTEGSIHL